MKNQNKHHANLDLSIIGKRFGKLIVSEYSHTIKGKDTYWICKCDCGNYKTAARKNLTNNTRSCGCLLKKPKNRPLSFYPDLTGQKFNRLTPIKRIGINDNGIIWECLCDCGKITTATTGQLRFGNVKSCGCARIDSQLINLIGQKFGSFTVIERIFKINKNGKYKGKKVGLWKCKCDCGSVRNFAISGLKGKKLKCCQDCRNYNGESNGNWNPNLSNEERMAERHHNPHLREWRKQIYKRDNYTCQVTGTKSNGNGNICAHHLESYNSNPDLRYELTNGITVLQSLHRKFHSIYGLKNNTRQQFEEFVQNLTQEELKLYK